VEAIGSLTVEKYYGLKTISLRPVFLTMKQFTAHSELI
jgi:hypothetical protein